MRSLSLKFVIASALAGLLIGCSKNLKNVEPFARYVGQEVATQHDAILVPTASRLADYELIGSGLVFSPERGQQRLPAGSRLHIEKIERVFLMGHIHVDARLTDPNDPGQTVRVMYGWPRLPYEYMPPPDPVYTEESRLRANAITPALWEPTDTPFARAPVGGSKHYVPIQVEPMRELPEYKPR